MIAEWIEAFLSVLTGFTSGLVTAIVNVFDGLLYTTVGDTKQLSTVAIVGILTIGTGFIIGLVKGLVNRFSNRGK